MLLRRLPVTAILSACLFLVGVSAAAIAPYRAIAAIDTLGMSNSLYALIITLSSVGTAVASLVMGYFSDRVHDRRLLVITTALLGGVAYGLIYLVPTQLTYIVSFCAILPFGGALFSQTFSFSRVYYNLRNPARAEFTMSALRTLFSVSWVVVPPLAGWIASTYAVFDLFAVAALAHLGCTLMFGLLLANPEAKVSPAVKKHSGTDTGMDTVPTGWHIPGSRLIGIGGVTLVRVALALHLTTLPLALINDFGGTLRDVGIAASLAAGLEVPCMLAWGWAAGRVSKETILIVNALIYAVYLLFIFFARTVQDVLWLQGLNAVATAALLSITISYMQESVKGRVGLSTSLMDVTTVVSAFVASAVFAALSSEGNYTAVFVAASVVSLAGAGFLALSRASRFIEVTEASKAD